MERLTERSLDYCTQLCSDEDAISCAFYKGEQEEKCWRANMYDRLASYEDTGLEPEEVKEITSWSYGPFHKKMGDWLKAEHEGRLLVLPCKVGDTVYRVWPYRKPIITEHKMHDLTEIAKYIDAFGVTFGKTAFLTRADAEAALEGVSEDA